MSVNGRSYAKVKELPPTHRNGPRGKYVRTFPRLRMAEPSQSWPLPLLFQPVNLCPTCLHRLAEGLPKRPWVSTLCLRPVQRLVPAFILLLCWPSQFWLLCPGALGSTFTLESTFTLSPHPTPVTPKHWGSLRVWLSPVRRGTVNTSCLIRTTSQFIILCSETTTSLNLKCKVPHRLGPLKHDGH